MRISWVDDQSDADEVSDTTMLPKEQLSVTKKENKLRNEKTYWRNWYVIVFAFLVLQIVLYYFITQHFKN